VRRLVARTEVGRPDSPPPGPRGRPVGDEHHDLLRVGAQTAAALARYAPADPDLLAAAVALPWYDAELRGIRGQLYYRVELDWPAAMVLAMVPPKGRGDDHAAERHRYRRQLAGLPPLLRAAVLIERHLASGIPTLIRESWGALRPFDRAELAELAAGIPGPLLPPPGPPAPRPGPAPTRPRAADRWWQPPLPPDPGLSLLDGPVGSPAEAIRLVGQRLNDLFAGYLLRPGGDPGYRVGGPTDPGFLVDGAELVYTVRWNAPPETLRPIAPQYSNPGDGPRAPFREPGWIVDRVTREVTAVDLAFQSADSCAADRRLYPLPPGWLPTGRQPFPDGFAGVLAWLLTGPAAAEPHRFAAAGFEPATLAAALSEATARYAGRLATPSWPDLLVALRVAERTAGALRGAGVTEPAALIGAVLAARGPAASDTLLDEASPLWRTAAGDLARPDGGDLDGAGAAARAARLRAAAPAVRALVLANARARYGMETELFGSTPRARRDELAALEVLANPGPPDVPPQRPRDEEPPPHAGPPPEAGRSWGAASAVDIEMPPIPLPPMPPLPPPSFPDRSWSAPPPP
jgi:hypothetical protein